MIEREAAARGLIPDMRRDLTAALAAERPRLVGLCARIVGGWEDAEDLAQETLAEAWRARAKLRDDQGDDQGLALWLNAIARHVCLRWRRSQARELGAREGQGEHTLAEAALAEAGAADGEELSLALERGELAELLERALALLPAETRALLIETYVRECSQTELAARRGLSVEIVRARLHRGRSALRRILTTDLRAEALAADLVPPEAARWQRTRIWCPFCGRHPLEATIDRERGEYSYRCAGDCQPGSGLVGGARDAQLLGELASPKAILTRHCLGSFVSYRDAIAGREESCPECGSRVSVRQPLPDGSGGTPQTPLFVYGVYVECPTCGPMAHASPWHLTLQTPSALRFWRRHPRMRALPTQEIEYGGRAAIVTGFESAEGAARLEVVSARETYEVLRVFGAGGEADKRGEARA